MSLFISFLLLIVSSLSAHAEFNKAQLDLDLYLQYLPYLEAQFGKCEYQNCFEYTKSGTKLVLPQRTICFPGTQCGFYRCMEEKYRCSDVGEHYFSKLAWPTCSKYVKNISEKKFSPAGEEWVYRVMVCLQKGLVDDCEAHGNCDLSHRKSTCSHITEFTLNFHPGCYLNSGVGICNLPIKDQVQIWKTVAPFLTKRERVQARRVAATCLKKKSSVQRPTILF